MCESMSSREELRLWDRAWTAGAEAEHTRLTPRITLLKEAVAVRDEHVLCMAGQLRKLRSALSSDPTTASLATKQEQEQARLAMAVEIATLEETCRAAAARIAALERAAASDSAKLDYWTWWAWAGQPAAVNADGKVYESKIAALERAVKYWEHRALSANPATTQAMADRDAVVKYSCSHLSLRQLREALEKA
tara:strand:+ start:764 stop:1342 length:579 start_codon:yes stop_codon:yes gene_type:complete